MSSESPPAGAPLDEWARCCHRIQERLQACKDAVSAGNAAEARSLAEGARSITAELLRDLRRHGAGAEPRPCDETPDPTLILLQSEANRRWEEALRVALDTLRDVEREREIPDGNSLILESWLVDVHEELYGPPGLGEGPS